jgi:hypothetical protein
MPTEDRSAQQWLEMALEARIIAAGIGDYEAKLAWERLAQECEENARIAVTPTKD